MLRYSGWRAVRHSPLRSVYRMAIYESTTMFRDPEWSGRINRRQWVRVPQLVQQWQGQHVQELQLRSPSPSHRQSDDFIPSPPSQLRSPSPDVIDDDDDPIVTCSPSPPPDPEPHFMFVWDQRWCNGHSKPQRWFQTWICNALEGHDTPHVKQYNIPLLYCFGSHENCCWIQNELNLKYSFFWQNKPFLRNFQIFYITLQTQCHGSEPQNK
jgi:hypothetical protein